MHQIWGKLKLELQTLYTPQIYSTWIENIYINEEEDKELILYVRNRFQKDWIIENKKTLMQSIKIGRKHK